MKLELPIQDEVLDGQQGEKCDFGDCPYIAKALLVNQETYKHAFVCISHLPEAVEMVYG